MSNGQVYYDSKTGKYYTLVNYGQANDAARRAGQVQFVNQGGFNIPIPMYRQYIGAPTNSSSSSSPYGKNLNQGSTKPLPIPSYMPAGLQVYGSEPVTPAARPTPQTRPGVAPQFDMSFLQQLMTQRAQQPAAPAGPPTLTPRQQYGNPAMGGGLAALRAIAGPQPATPTALISPTTGV